MLSIALLAKLLGNQKYCKGEICMMPTESNYDLYITDKDRTILLEERSLTVHAAEKIIRDYPWRNRPQSYAQIMTLKNWNNFWQNTGPSKRVISFSRNAETMGESKFSSLGELGLLNYYRMP
jgi:hypothetical protein